MDAFVDGIRCWPCGIFVEELIIRTQRSEKNPHPSEDKDQDPRLAGGKLEIVPTRAYLPTH